MVGGGDLNFRFQDLSISQPTMEEKDLKQDQYCIFGLASVADPGLIGSL